MSDETVGTCLEAYGAAQGRERSPVFTDGSGRQVLS